MKGVILLNGEPYSGDIDTENKFVVCCDGALRWAEGKGVRIDLITGDFDSLGYVPEGAVKFPAEKDQTDGEIALDLLAEKGADEIEIYGGAGRREDHFFGNVGLLIKAKRLGIKAVFITDHTEFYIVDGRAELVGKKGKTVSLVPLTEKLRINNSEGLKYGMKDLVITLGESRGLSNIVTEDKAFFEISEGEGLLFIVRRL
ncbi:MAG: thiamine diphosphokinase [Clostridia bacterium]|nr:thiamine diphosphokinase [Clostridia bacterium]